MTPAEEDRGDRLPTEQQPEREPGNGVEHHVEQARSRPDSQPAAQFGIGVLQSEREQQQQHADLGADLEELLRDVERDDSALPDARPATR